MGNFTQIPSPRYKYVLIMICMFSHWVKKTFPCRRATALRVGKVSLEKLIPSWGISSELYSNRGTPFTGQIMQLICNILPILQHFHCAYHHPQSSGMVEHTNSTIKTQLAKFSETFSLP